ncbi:MAG: sterol desaturase family protein, partial [Planctomycetaceae bacterium]|nr:sterol desaturase family protein [Planctomycetaceae bacterium]
MIQLPKKQETWNHTAPVVFSALFDWPPKPKEAFLELTKRWATITRNVLFLAMAFLVSRYLIPDATALRSLSLEWVCSIFLRNYLFMLVIAGGLHLYLFTFALQGRRLKYDPRRTLAKGRKYSFQNQVFDNVFWSLASGATIWSIY